MSYEKRKAEGRLPKYVSRHELPEDLVIHIRNRDNNYHLQNPDISRKSGKKYSRTPKGRYKFMKNTAAKRKLNVSLTLEEFTSLIEKLCHYCNDEMNTPSVMGIGIDRIDNEKGYEIDNVLPCCTACNVIKSDYLTVEETKIAIDAVLKFRKKDLN